MTRSILTAAVLAALIGAGPALAQSGGWQRGPGPALDFDAIDAEGTGTIDRARLEAFGAERLAALDGDGRLDRDELAAAMPARERGMMGIFTADPALAGADRMLAMFGATEEGAIAIDAIVRRQVDMIFTRLDRDGDGVISREEAERRAGRPMMRPRHN